MHYDSTVLRPRTQDLTNTHFERWTVLCFAGYKGRYAYWTCKCQCVYGTIKDVAVSNLRNHSSKSCGCLLHECLLQRNTSHGKRQTPEYTIWRSMRQRCEDSNSSGFYKYGLRGITVCKQWHDFAVFYEDMGPRPSKKHSIERLDNEGNYTPDNCVWATSDVQSRNTRQNVMLTYDGITQCATDWAHTLGMKPKLLQGRIRDGWSTEEALLTPNNRRQKTKRRASILKNLDRVFLTHDGITQSAREWANSIPMKPKSFLSRLHAGWSMEEALRTPLYMKRSTSRS